MGVLINSLIVNNFHFREAILIEIKRATQCVGRPLLKTVNAVIYSLGF